MFVLNFFSSRKKIAALLLLIFIMSGLVFLFPQNAEAQIPLLPPPINRVQTMVENIEKPIEKAAKKTYAQMAATAFKTALGTFLNKVAYDMAVAVATGAPGQKSLIFDDPNYFLNLGDAVMGNAVDDIAQGSGFTNMLGTTSLCQPVDLTAKVNMLLSFKKPAEPPKPRCSLSQMSKSLSESANSFTNSFSLANLSLRFEMGDLEEARNSLRKSLTVERYLDSHSAIYANLDGVLRDLEKASDDLSGLIQRIYQKPIAERQAAADGELKNLSEVQTQLILNQNKISQIQEMINDCGSESGNCTETGAAGVCQIFIDNPLQMNCSAAVSTAQTYHSQFQKLETDLTDGMNNLYTGILEKAFTVPDASDPKDIGNAFNREANDLGKFAILKEAKDNNVNIKVENEKLLQRISKDCEPKKDPVSGMNVLPASAACGMFNFAMSKSTVNEESYTGIFSQALSIFTNTLAGKLMQNWFEIGVANLFGKGKGKNNTSPSDVAAGNLPRGKAAAEEKFLTLLQSNFTAGGPFEVLRELTTCPEQGAGPNNCIVDQDFSQAIAERLTLKEAMDKKLLDPKRPFGYLKSGSIFVEPSYLSGYPYRSMIVLRKFRIIPVGWELAAEWIKKDNSISYTLQDVVDCYEDSTCTKFVPTKNPFYHLVDPGWVFLEQPAFCKRQGAGEKILAEEFFCSKPDPSKQDGSCLEFSRNVFRQEYCADEQTCLLKNDDGSCRFYGYCSEDTPSWKLDGSSCKPEYNSCQTYGDKDGENVSYLEHTISGGGCNSGNANCQWYCEEAPLICSGGSKNGEPCSNNNDCAPAAGGIVDGVCRPTDLWKCQGKNLIGNGGVEVNNSGWIDFGTGSNNWINTSGYESFAGLSSADNSSNESGWKSLPISFYVGESIDASGWINVSFAGGGASIRLRNLTSNTTIAESEIITELNIWKPIHLTASISADANIALELVTHNNATAMFDNIGLFRSDRISFDKDIKKCEAKDAGCHEFSRTTNGANLIFNPSFEIEEKNYTENPAAGSGWYGWHLPEGESMPTNVSRETAVIKSGKSSLKIENSTSPTVSVAVGLETADPRNSNTANFDEHKYLPEESYTVSVYAKAQTDCAGDCLELVGDCRGDGPSLGISSGSFKLTTSWEKYSFNFNYKKDKSIAYDDDYCRFFTRFTQNNTYWLDDAKLEIGSQSTNYKDYGGEKIYLNESRLSCDLSEVGCELYTPANGDIGIPAVAKISDQCPAECVGYETYHEIPSYFDPVEDAALEIVFPNLIPSTAVQCSAQAAGCEEFTNLDTVASGGEAKEYYTYIRQCAKPGTTTEATYYTWEGSEEAGFQLRAWKFKAYADGSPYTIDSTLTCDLANPDCRIFYTQSGTAFQRFLSKTVFISNDCQPLRRTIEGSRDDCLGNVGLSIAGSGGYQWDDPDNDGQGICYYNVIPSQGLKCEPKYAGCREYKGPSANNQTSLFKYDFEDIAQTSDWSPGDRVNESVSVGGHSLRVLTDSTSHSVASLVNENRAYILKFWAKKASSNLTNLSVRFNDGANNIFFGDPITLSDDWNSYMFGPADFTARKPSAGEELVIASLEDFYIDNIELIEVADDVFVVKDSWATPASCDLDPQGDSSSGYALHCSAYTDRAKNVHNLKSFSKLCREDHVGCELLTDTQDTQNPFSEWKSAEYISADVLTPIVNDDKKYCDGKFKGCQKFGQPKLDAGDSVTSWNSIYLINNPDNYKEILCQNTENWCVEYKTPDGSEKYFKDPGEKLCEYKEDIGVGNTVTSGWFIKGQYEKINPPECAGAMRHCSIPRNGSYLFCRQDSDCQPADKNGKLENLGTCVAKDTEWVRECPETQSSCTEYIDPLFSRTQGVKDRYYYLADTIDEGKCKGIIDEDQKCVAFNDSENPIMNVRASGTCKTRPDLYCSTNAECSAITPDDICLMKSDKPFDPQACVRCSADQLSCNPDPSKPNPCCQKVIDAGQIACDANTILYVQKDRDCREWLSCVSSAKITNAQGEKENVCYDIARCTRIDPVTGACLEQAKDVNYCQRNLFCAGGTRKGQACQADSDCAQIDGTIDGACQPLAAPKVCSADSQCQSFQGLCNLLTTTSPFKTCSQNRSRACVQNSDCVIDQGPCIADSQTFDSPTQTDHKAVVDDLRYRSGFNPYGIHWTQMPIPNERKGEYFPTTTMQKGQVILLDDGDFEKQNSAWSRFSKCSTSPTQCVNNTTCLSGDTCNLGAGKCSVTGGNCKKDNECFASDSCGGVCSNNNAIRCRDNQDCGAIGTCNRNAMVCYVSGNSCKNDNSTPANLSDDYADDLLCGRSDTCSQTEDFDYERIKAISGMRSLKLGPGKSAFQGNYPGATNFNDIKPIFVTGNSQIALSGYLNTVDLKNGTAEIEIQEFKNGAKAFEYEIPAAIVMKQEFGKPWKFYAGIFTTRPETVSIRIVLKNTGTNGSAYFDNFLMLPVLNYQNQSYQVPFLEAYDLSRVNSGLVSPPGENPLIGRSCRLYPQTNAPACSYTNEQKQQFQGWRGFCVEPDPVNPLQCLQWLPIDQLQGEAGLGFKTETSYSGKTPLYYCAEMSLWQLRCNSYNQKVWDGNFDQNECPTKSSVDPSCPSTYSHGNKCLKSKIICGLSANKREWCQVVGVPGPWAEDKNTDCFWVPYRSCPYGTRDMAATISPNLIGRCDKLIETVDAEGQNIAWTNRIDQKSFEMGTPYGYVYDADQNSPLYGSVFVLAQENELPSDWQTTFDKTFITAGNVRTNTCSTGQTCQLTGEKKCTTTGINCTLDPGVCRSSLRSWDFCLPVKECHIGAVPTGISCKGEDLTITKSSSGKYPLWVIPKSEDGAAGAGIDACMVSFGGSPLSCTSPYCYNNKPTPLIPPSLPPSLQCQDPTKKSFALNVAEQIGSTPTDADDQNKNNQENFVQGAERLQHLFSKSYSTWVWNTGECELTDSANICAGECSGALKTPCLDDSYCPSGETCSTNQETGSGCDPVASGYHCSGDPKKSCVNEYDNASCVGFGSCKYYNSSKDDGCNKPSGKCTPAGGGVCQTPITVGGDTAGYVSKVCSATCLGGSCVPTLRCSTSDAPCATAGDPCVPAAGGICTSYDRCDNNPATTCNPTDDCAKVVDDDACPGGGVCQVCDSMWGGFFSTACVSDGDKICVGGIRNDMPCEFTPVCTNKRCVDPLFPLEMKGFCINDSQCDKLDYNDDSTVDSTETCTAVSPRACFPGGYDPNDSYTALKECINDLDCAGTVNYNSCAVFDNRCAVNKINGSVLIGSEKVGAYCNNDQPCLAETSMICDSGDNAGKSCAGPADCPGGNLTPPSPCVYDDGVCAAKWCTDGPLSQAKCTAPADCLAAGLKEHTYVNIGDVRGTTPNPNFAKTLWNPPDNQCPWNQRPKITQPPNKDIILETGEMCGVAPEIKFINKPGDGSLPSDIKIDEGNSVTINFLTSIDAEQRPIRQIAIDWGAGASPQILHLSSSDGTGLASKTLISDPFTFTSSPYADAGTYTITVMVQDNWNWCNGAVDKAGCYADTNTGGKCDLGGCGNADNWLPFPGKIIVK